MAYNNGPTIVTNGLVLSLDAADRNSYPGSGTTWRDMSGRGNNGTLTGGPPTFNSDNGGNIVFNGSSDYVNCGNISPTILSNNQFTFIFWFNMKGSARGDLLSIKNFNSPQDDIGFFIDTNNKLCAYFSVQGVTTSNVGILASVSNTTFSRNTIYNIACIKDESQKIVMYVNGILDNNTYSTTTNTANVAITPVWLGSNKNNDTVTSNAWNGNIYSSQTYNRALSAAEILQNYNALKSRFGL